MAYPFYQGNLQDLMRYAGPMQGTYFLSQLADQQKRENESRINESILGQEIKRAEEKRKSEMHPLDMEKVRAQIDKWKVENEHMGAQTQGLKNTNDTFTASGGPPAAAAATKVSRDEQKRAHEAKLDEDYFNEILGLEWSPNLRDQLNDIHTRFQTNPNKASMNYGQAMTKESWDKYRQNLYEATMKAREQAQKEAAQTERTRITATQATERAVEVARMRAEAQAAKDAQVRNLQHAATVLQQEAFFIREAARNLPDGPQKKAALEKADRNDAQARIYLDQARTIKPEQPSFEIPGMTRRPPTPIPTPGGATAAPAPGAVTHIWEGGKLIPFPGTEGQ